LNAGLHGKLTLASAPAGFGKTTLITDWLSHLNRPVGWVSLDEDDSDPQQFFRYLAAAIRPFPDISHTLTTLLKSPQPLPAKALAAALVNDLVSVSTPCLLILDDYHEIDSAEIDLALAFVLDHMPPSLHLVFTSRTDPGFPISRLRVRNEMSEIRANDLRFSKIEAAQFLQKSMNLTLSKDQIAALETRTEGWIAGLQMAALSMQGRSDTTTFISDFTGSHHFVLDYLVEEVMQSLPERTRNFLLQTSIFDKLSGSLCDAITGQEDGRAMLEGLERGNMFVVPLDDERQWYRYHHLFADMLQARLMDEQSDYIPTLHRRASNWYEQNGSPHDAIRQALAAKDFERAAGLIELVWPAIEVMFQSKRWLRWAKALPDDLVRTRPVLNLDYAWAFLNDGDLEAAKSCLQDAERWLNAPLEPIDGQSGAMVVVDEEQFLFLPASIASAYSYAALALGDIPDTVAYARQALSLLPENDYFRRGPAAILLGLAYWASGDLEPAHIALAEAMAGFHESGNTVFAISSTYGLADIKIAQGRLREAISIYEGQLQLALAQGDPPIPGTADLYLGLSKLYRERGDVEAARQNLSKSEALGEQAALADWPYRFRIAQARIKQTEGDMDSAIALLDEAERLYFSTPVPNPRPIIALKTQVWIAQGRLTGALDWARARDLSVDGDLSYLREFEFMTLARIRIAQYKNEQAENAIHEAMRLIERLLQAAEDGERMGNVIEILVLQALAYEAQGDIPAALVPLERALTLAEPEGYVCVFVDEGLPMARLLGETVVSETMPAYTNKLLAVLQADGHSVADNATLPPAQPLVEQPEVDQPPVDSLSKREMEILILIADGLRNKEIAEQLMISLNTVLYHIKNIYSKLGVNKRTLAVAKAKELNLIN